jgi:repressor LexA
VLHSDGEGTSKLKKKVFEFIKQFIAENGYAPTVREIADGVGTCVPSTVLTYLQILKSEGYVNYVDGKSRTIRILKELEGG